MSLLLNVAIAVAIVTPPNTDPTNAHRAGRASCLTASPAAQEFVEGVKLEIRSSDDSAEVALESSVALVTSTVTCDSAVAAFNATNPSETVSALYVVVVPTVGYVVYWPGQTILGFEEWYDSTWHFKARVTY